MCRLICASRFLLVSMILAACGSVAPDIEEQQGALTPQLVLLPIIDEYLNDIWHPGNWHGTTGNPFPPYCPTTTANQHRYCIYDVQAYQDNDMGDRDHLSVAGGLPPWGTDEAAADGWPEMFKVDSLRNELSLTQWQQLAAIDYVEVRVVASVTPPPGANTESIIPEIGHNPPGDAVNTDPVYVPQDGVAHELVWQIFSNPLAGRPWAKSDFDIVPNEAQWWGFANGNYIGVNRPGGLFVHSLAVYAYIR